MSKGIYSWVWIMAGILAAVIMFLIAYNQILASNRVRIEQDSIKQFNDIVSNAKNLCWSYLGNRRVITVNLGDMVQGIYAANSPYEEYSKEDLIKNIVTNSTNTGIYLCLNIVDKKIDCQELTCNITFPFIGTVPEEFSLSALVNSLMGKGKTYIYSLSLMTFSEGIKVFLAGHEPTTTTTTTPPEVTTTIPGATTTQPGATTTASTPPTTVPGTPGVILIFTVSDVVSKVGQSLIDQYIQALSEDRLTPKLIKLDVSGDVKGCDPGSSASSVPVPSSDAQRIIPACISKFNAGYVVILGGHNYIKQKELSPDSAFCDVFYSDDWYADTSGNDGIPDVAIGRIPDGISHTDNVISDYIQKVAIPLHKSAWGGVDSKYSYVMRAAESDTYAWEDTECFIYGISGSRCGLDSTCYLSPPNTGVPSGWSGNSKLFFLDMHGDEEGYQQFVNDHGQKTVGASDANSRNWDKTLALLYPCWGGRIHNVDLSDSFVLTALDKSAAFVIGGTCLQTAIVSGRDCNQPPEGSNYCYSSNIFYKLVKNLSPGTRVGDAFKSAKQGFFSECNSLDAYQQGHQDVFYGDPSIKV